MRRIRRQHEARAGQSRDDGAANFAFTWVYQGANNFFQLPTNLTLGRLQLTNMCRVAQRPDFKHTPAARAR
jgi:hypothetical protein